jgi:hypothetical protein
MPPTRIRTARVSKRPPAASAEPAILSRNPIPPHLGGWSVRDIDLSWRPEPRATIQDLQKQLVLLSSLRRLDGVVAEEVDKMPLDLFMLVSESEFFHGYMEKQVAAAKVEGEATILIKQLTKRFGVLPPGVEERLNAAGTSQLEEWSLRLMDATSLDQVFSD